MAGWQHYIPGKNPETITGSSPGKQFREMIEEIHDKVVCDVEGDDKYIFVRKNGQNKVRIEFQPDTSRGASSGDNPPSGEPEDGDGGGDSSSSTGGEPAESVRVDDVSLSMSGTQLSVEVTLTNGSSESGSIDLGPAIRAAVLAAIAEVNPVVGVSQSEWSMTGSSLNHILELSTYSGVDITATPVPSVGVVGCAAYSPTS